MYNIIVNYQKKYLKYKKKYVMEKNKMLGGEFKLKKGEEDLLIKYSKNKAEICKCTDKYNTNFKS